MDARTKEEEKTTEQPTPEQQYDDAWEELETTPEGEQTTDEEGKTGLSDTDPEEKPERGYVSPEHSESLKKEEAKADDPTDKRIKDLQAGFTKVTQENAELKRMLEEFKAGNVTKQQVEEQQKKADDAKALIDESDLATLYREYPETKGVIGKLLDTVTSLSAETASLKQATEQNRAKSEAERQEEAKKQALNHFETQVLPKVTQGDGGHPDFKEIIANEDYWNWAKEQRPGLRTAAMDSSDPEDIKWALSEYKKSRAKPEAEKVKQQEQQQKQNKLNNAMSLRGGSTPFPAKSGSKDPDDYDDGWEEAAKLLDRRK